MVSATKEAQEAGVPTEEQAVYEDYFGFAETRTFYFPDGKTFITYEVMNEGAKAAFQKLTNRDITLERTTQNARIKVDPASERHQLIVQSATGWNLHRRNAKGAMEPVPFSKGSPGAMLEQWLAVTNPKLVEDLELAIRRANPWLQADMTVEQVDEEMDRLRDLREELVKRDMEKTSSSSK